MFLEVILSFLASMAIGTLWYSKSGFGSVWLRHTFGDANESPKCPKNAYLFTSLGSLSTMILLANLFGVELASATLMTALVKGFKLGLLVCLTQISHAAFNRTPVCVYLVDCGYDMALICAAAVIMYYF